MKTYMECLEIAAAKLGTPELAIDIQFAHEDKHYELMQTAADLYLYLSNSHKHGVMQAEGSDGAKGAAVGNSAGGQNGSVGLCLHEPMLKSGLRMCMHCLNYY